MSKDIATISRTKEILEKYDLQAKKSFGQNFLIDNNITKNIVKNGNVDKDTCVIEIGPGIGSLTQEISRVAKKVVCVEIDERLKIVLEDTLEDIDNVEIVFSDFLKLDLDEFINQHFENEEKIVVVANLPYYITTAILLKIFESKARNRITSICAMMQKEVGLRLSASKNTKDYNSLTILTEYYCTTKIVMKIPKSVFIPAPNVDSVVVLFTFREVKNKPINEELFFKILRILFKQRRKTILNNLNEYFHDKTITLRVLNEAKLNPKYRAENLSLDEIIKLAYIIERRSLND